MLGMSIGNDERGDVMSLQANYLNAIPIAMFVIATCAMSYWHGRSEYGWRIGGLIFTIILGICGQILVGLFPMIL